MSDTEPAWRPTSAPTEPGWYAIHYSWDAAEGSFCGVAYFDGANWGRRVPVFELAGPFTTSDDAELCAAEHEGFTF